MIRDFVHLIQNKLRHYAVFPSLHSLSRSSAFQTALFLLGVLAFARACIFLAPPSVTTLASASVNGTFMPICRVETDQKKVALTFNCTYSAQDLNQLLEILKEKNVHATFFVSDAWAKNYPELLCTIHNAGHDIGGLWTTQASLSGNRPSHWKISRSELIALPILKRRCFVLKMETMTTLLSGSSRNPAVTRCSGTSIPWTGKTMGHRTSSIGF